MFPRSLQGINGFAGLKLHPLECTLFFFLCFLFALSVLPWDILTSTVYFLYNNINNVSIILNCEAPARNEGSNKDG